MTFIHKIYVIAPSTKIGQASAFMETEVCDHGKGLAFACVTISQNGSASIAGSVHVTGRFRKTLSMAKKDLPILKRTAVNAAIDLGVLPKGFELPSKPECTHDFDNRRTKATNP